MRDARQFSRRVLVADDLVLGQGDLADRPAARDLLRRVAEGRRATLGVGNAGDLPLPLRGFFHLLRRPRAVRDGHAPPVAVPDRRQPSFDGRKGRRRLRVGRQVEATGQRFPGRRKEVEVEGDSLAGHQGGRRGLQTVTGGIPGGVKQLDLESSSILA